MRININAAGCGTARSPHYMTYGLGFDWKFTDVCS